MNINIFFENVSNERTIEGIKKHILNSFNIQWDTLISNYQEKINLVKKFNI